MDRNQLGRVIHISWVFRSASIVCIFVGLVYISMHLLLFVKIRGFFGLKNNRFFLSRFLKMYVYFQAMISHWLDCQNPEIFFIFLPRHNLNPSAAIVRYILQVWDYNLRLQSLKLVVKTKMKGVVENKVLRDWIISNQSRVSEPMTHFLNVTLLQSF